MLPRTHLPKRRNLLIAATFHRRGAVEIRSRRTKRVIAASRAHGIRAHIFEERRRFVVVTVRPELVPCRPRRHRYRESKFVVVTVRPELVPRGSTPQVVGALTAVRGESKSREALQDPDLFESEERLIVRLWKEPRAK
jgi:hypothetical protein